MDTAECLTLRWQLSVTAFKDIASDSDPYCGPFFRTGKGAATCAFHRTAPFVAMLPAALAPHVERAALTYVTLVQVNTVTVTALILF